MAGDTLEVYYNQNGRWQLHATYEVGQREQAIEEAKNVEQKEGFATRVVRETFQPETNTTDTVITWQSAKAKNINDADNMFGTAPGGKGQQKPAQKSRPPRSAPPRPVQPPPSSSQNPRSSKARHSSPHLYAR